jgi:two-component system probable response regulator PhcQ
MKHSILIVDDESSVIASLKRSLLDEDYTVHTALSGEEGLKILKQHRVKVVLSDERMPGMTGAKFLALVKDRYQDTVRMMLTGHASIEATMHAVNAGEIYRFFVKPWNDIELKQAIRSAMEKHDLEVENRRLLSTVKRQALEIKFMEKQYPGISEMVRDGEGAISLPEISEEEYSSIVEECNKESC